MSSENHQKSSDGRVKIDNAVLNEKLRTWYPAAIGELSEVTETLKLAQEDIVDCDAEMDRLRSAYQAEMHRLSARREGLILCTEKLSGLLSPIRRLPDELLCLIFLDCCTENDMRNRKPGEALTLSSVCTRFRQLAISYPALWSNLKVLLPSEYEDIDDPETPIQDPGFLEEETKLTSLIQLYLDRSENRLLTLDLDID
ncbi:hypothetical protein BDP27DRAFT_1222385, partial [Rhodocollybia butyracea]